MGQLCFQVTGWAKIVKNIPRGLGLTRDQADTLIRLRSAWECFQKTGGKGKQDLRGHLRT